MTIVTTAAFTEGPATDSCKLDRVEEHLVTRFCPPLRREEVQRCLTACLAAYESARVRAYVALLVERDATAQLELIVDSPRG